MKIPQITYRAFAFTLVAALLAPVVQPVSAASPEKIADVGLTDAGLLLGQVVDNLGKPVAGSQVELAAQGGRAVQVKTNELGYFALKNVPAGVYMASAPGTSQLVRIWSPNTAPPVANQGVLLVQSDRTARAQDAKGKGGKGKGASGVNWRAVAIGAGIGAGLTAILDYNDNAS